MWLLVLALVVVPLAAVAAWGVALAVSSRRAQAAANEVVPGVRSRAPVSWAGAHSPEARLHRRLRDVVVAVRALPGADGVSVDGRMAFERHVMTLDERLVAVAALPESVRDAPLAVLRGAVERLEETVGKLASEVAGSDLAVDHAVRDLSEGFAALNEATLELDELLLPEPKAEPSDDSP